jgi:hypothetical protein
MTKYELKKMCVPLREAGKIVDNGARTDMVRTEKSL